MAVAIIAITITIIIITVPEERGVGDAQGRSVAELRAGAGEQPGGRLLEGGSYSRRRSRGEITDISTWVGGKGEWRV